MDECALRRRVLELGIPCDEGECLFWTELGPHPEDARPQCAVQYFKLLHGADSQLADWLLGLKDSQIFEALGMGRDGAGR